VLAAQLDDPLSRAVRRGYLLAAGFSLLLSLVASTAVAVVTARQRQREVAILGLLGAGSRETANAVFAELAPAAVTGAVVGSVVGWLVARSYDGRFDLSAFAAGTPVSIRVDTVALVVAAGAVTAASLVVIAVLVRRIVTVKATDILRIDGAA
jgi:putative ABC transport system permease protein